MNLETEIETSDDTEAVTDPVDETAQDAAEVQPAPKKRKKAKDVEPVSGEVAVIVDRNFNEHRFGDKLILEPEQAKLWLEKRLVRLDEGV